MTSLEERLRERMQKTYRAGGGCVGHARQPCSILHLIFGSLCTLTNFEISGIIKVLPQRAP